MADLRKLLDDATPGPWAVDSTSNHVGMREISGPSLTCRGFTIATDVDYRRAALIEADARLIALAPQLAAALIKAEEALAESVEIVHKEYVRATLETVNAGPHHLLQKQMDAWRVRCMNAEKVSRAALSEIRALTGGRHD